MASIIPFPLRVKAYRVKLDQANEERIRAKMAWVAGRTTKDAPELLMRHQEAHNRWCLAKERWKLVKVYGG